MKNMEIGKFAYFMNSNGMCVIGKLVSIEESPDGKEKYYVDGTVICDTIRQPTQQQGIFTFSYMIIPVNCLEAETVDIMITDVNFMFEIKEESVMAKLYTNTIEQWERRKSDIVLARPGDEKKLANLIDITKQ